MERQPDRNARVLMADDEESVVASLERTLRMAGYTNLQTICDSRLILPLYERFKPDLLLLDLAMPYLDGLAVLRQLASRIGDSEYFPVLVLTADQTAAAKQSALSLGAKDFLVKPCDTTEMLLRVKNLLETRSLHLQLRQQNENLETAVIERTRDLEEAQFEAVARLALAAEYRDDETGQHTIRVGRLAELLAQNLDVPADIAAMIGQAAPLHDVGKIGIPDAILLKPAGLTAQEYKLMKTHTMIGAQILGGSRSPLLRLAETIALYHHEQWDGRGYEGLEGDAIPLPARIVAVADAFDVMTHDRRYRRSLPVSAALAEIRLKAGKHFDPSVAEALLKIRISDGVFHSDEDHLEPVQEADYR